MDFLLNYDRCLSRAISINCLDEKRKDVGREKVLRQFLLLLEYSGHGIPWIGVTMFMIYFRFDMRAKQFYCNLLLALLLDLLFVALLKVIVRRKRPQNNVDDMFATVSVDRYSFPSGHSSRAAMVTLLFSLYWKSTSFVVLGYVWASMVATSRVALGRHHVLDVILGMVLGYFEYYITLQVWLPLDTCMRLTNVL